MFIVDEFQRISIHISMTETEYWHYLNITCQVMHDVQATKKKNSNHVFMVSSNLICAEIHSRQHIFR